ncbi:barstar family protein [Kaistella sp. 97-N-M2]|uniref:barstar family protein n=1 Tax=Kaistella sp. 97-N-M2 TaxID=2908645 RepID=UPI001F2C9B1A|nr:barstar family protein [Kaistella sp. 97-N-M2]UJF30418.1 barstar family protein [Kaistella sp. 97-N-M2]
MKEFTIEGKKIRDIKTFYVEINRVFMPDEDWKLGESLDALNDLLYGGFGEIEGKENIIIWKNFEENRKILGFETTLQFYEAKLKSPQIFNTNFIQEKIDDLKKGNGQTYFEIILEIIGAHSNIKLIEK